MILWMILIIVFTWSVSFRYRRRNMLKLAASIKDPKNNLPVIGVAYTLAGSTEDIMKSLQNFSYEAIENNGIIKWWLGHILYFILTDPVDMEVILKTCLEKDDLHRFMRKVIGNGAIFAPVSIWRKRRKILVPAFSPKIVDNFVKVFSEQSEVLNTKLSQCVGKENLDLWPFLSSYTLDSVGETALGVKINAQSNPNSLFLMSLNRILNLVCERIFHLWLQPDWIFKLFPKYKEHEACIGNMHEFINEVIKKKRHELSENKNKPEVDNEYSSNRILPAGSGIVVSIWGVHRDPKFWGPDAEHFDPNRFSPERYNLKYSCSYMPFSNGPRNCIGYQYALMSMKTTLANILRSFKIVGIPEKGPIPTLPVKLDIMMKAVDGYEVTLERRT